MISGSSGRPSESSGCLLMISGSSGRPSESSGCFTQWQTDKAVKQSQIGVNEYMY